MLNVEWLLKKNPILQYLLLLHHRHHGTRFIQLRIPHTLMRVFLQGSQFFFFEEKSLFSMCGDPKSRRKKYISWEMYKTCFHVN